MSWASLHPLNGVSVTAQEEAVLRSALAKYSFQASRSDLGDVVAAAVAQLNQLRRASQGVGMWDGRLVRLWFSEHREDESRLRRMGNSTGSLLFDPMSESSSAESGGGGLKRTAGMRDRRAAKRASSFSVSSGSSDVAAPRAQRNLSTFFSLEHTRLPKDPGDIFAVTHGLELAAQLAFNWKLEERVAAACDAVTCEQGGQPAAADMDGAPVVVSASGRAGSGEQAGTEPPSPSGVRVGAEVSEGPVVYFESLSEEGSAGSNGSDEQYDLDLGGVLPMQGIARSPSPSSSSWLVEAQRSQNVTRQWQSYDQDLVAATLTASGRFVAVSSRSSSGLSASAWVRQETGAEAEVPLSLAWTDAVSDDVSAMAFDEQRSLLWVAAGRGVAGFGLGGNASRAGVPQYRLSGADAGEAGRPSAVVVHDGRLCVAAGPVIKLWDLDDMEALASGELSSQVESSVSSLSDCDSPRGPEMDLSGFLSDARLRDSCRLCGQGLSLVGPNSRTCSECLTHVCVNCVHTYRLTSLGEKDTRLICNGCITGIRRRILADAKPGAASEQHKSPPKPAHKQQQVLSPPPPPSPSPPQQQQQQPQQQRRPLLPQHRHVVVPAGGSPQRHLDLMVSDFSATDSGLFVSLAGRPVALSWGLRRESVVRLFVGHTAAVTALASAKGSPSILATGSADRSAKIWDARARPPALTLVGGVSTVSAVALAGDGLTCFSGTEDGDVKVWDLRRQVPVCTLAVRGRLRQLGWSQASRNLVCVASRRGALPSYCFDSFLQHDARGSVVLRFQFGV